MQEYLVWCMTYDYMGSIQPISFLSFLYAQVLVNYFLFSPTSYLSTTKPGFDSSLENSFSSFIFVLGMTLHIL